MDKSAFFVNPAFTGGVSNSKNHFWLFEKEYKTNQTKTFLNEGLRPWDSFAALGAENKNKFVSLKKNGRGDHFYHGQRPCVQREKLNNNSLHNLVELGFQHQIFAFQIQNVHYYKCGYVFKPFFKTTALTKNTKNSFFPAKQGLLFLDQADFFGRFPTVISSL